MKCHYFLFFWLVSSYFVPRLAFLNNYILQFEEIGVHGTRILIYNLWLNDEGIYELSFDDDDEVCQTYFAVRKL